MGAIPEVDFSSYSLEAVTVNELELQNLAAQLHGAFTTSGFVYLRNHGIKQEKLKSLDECSKKFFSLSLDVKEKYATVPTKYQGWSKLENEKLAEGRPGDFKEAFNVTPFSKSCKWPNDEVLGFQVTVMDFFDQCQQLASRVLELIAISLNLEDRHLLKKCHNFSSGKNYSTLRLLHYPRIDEKTALKPGQIRCSEHSDYGSITLVFQDNVGGLEILSHDGTYIPAKPIPDTVIINIADLMQRWTDDELVSTKHRVILPDQSTVNAEARRSYIFFAQPDEDHICSSLKGFNKYPPITSRDYHIQKLATTESY